MIPLPSFILDFLSPEAFWQKVLAGGGELKESTANSTWFSLSPYAYPVRMSVVRFVVYGLFSYGLIQMLQSRRRISVAVSFLLAMGCFEALYGLMETYSGSRHVLWLKWAMRNSG